MMELGDQFQDAISIADEDQTDSDDVEDQRATFQEMRLFQAAMKQTVKTFKHELQLSLTNNLVSDKIYSRENSLIHVAAKFGNAKIVRVIAEEFPFLLTKEASNGDTVLHIAARAEDESVFNVLKDIRKSHFKDIEANGCGWKDVSLTAINKFKNTALHEALIHRRKRMAAELMLLVDQDVFFSKNFDDKSALYLSVEAGYLECVKHMLKGAAANQDTYHDKLKTGRSVIHAAIRGKHTEMVRFMLENLPKLFHIRDEEGMSPLHLAAAMGALPIVRILLKLRHGFGVDKVDKNGMMPIHHAAQNNSVSVIQELLVYSHDPSELVNWAGENILHVAAKCGRYKAVVYILKRHELKMLLNQTDNSGSTPLHLASMNCRPRIVSALTWDDRVKVDAKCTGGHSALDVIGSSGSASDQVFKQLLTWAALKAARTPKFNVTGSEKKKDKNSSELYKDRVNNLLLVSALVVTVTFAAGFTMPGAYNSSDAADPGMAINLKHTAFQMFVICDTIAMYSAMLVVVVLMWAQLGDIRIMKASLELALPLLGSALSMMCMAFMTGVYVTVSRLKWIAVFILIFGGLFLAAISMLFFLLGFPADSTKRYVRFVTYYLIYAMLRITGNLSESNQDMNHPTLPPEKRLVLANRIQKYSTST